MGDIYDQKMSMTDSFRIFGGNIFAHPLTEILSKHNIKENSSKGNI